MRLQVKNFIPGVIKVTPNPVKQLWTVWEGDGECGDGITGMRKGGQTEDGKMGSGRGRYRDRSKGNVDKEGEEGWD